MNLRFEKIALPQERARLVRFLTSEEWPFHVNRRLEGAKVETMIDAGTFDGSNHESYWILDQTNSEIGFIRLFDLDDIDDGYPLFDLRIRSSQRGQGIGGAAVSWLTDYLFEKHPKLDRIAGTTRVDNIAMRKVFRSCFFAKEGHIRNDWASSDGKMYDIVKYGLLRDDWKNQRITPVRWDDET